MNMTHIKQLLFFILLNILVPLPLLIGISASDQLAQLFMTRDKQYFTILKQKYLSPNLAIPTGSIASQLTEYGSDIVKYIRINGEKFSTAQQKELIAIKSVLSSNFQSFLTTMKTTLANAENAALFKVEYLGRDIPGLFDISFFNGALKSALKKLSHPLEVLVHLATLIVVFPSAINLDIVKNILKIRFFITTNISKYGMILLQTFFAVHAAMLIPALVAPATTSSGRKTSFLEKIWAIDLGIHVLTMPIRVKSLIDWYF
jgi:hypothetical protein